MCLKTSKSWRQKSLRKTGRVDSLLQDHAEHVTWKWTRFLSIIKIRIAKLLDIDGSSCIDQANHTKGLNFTPSGWKKLTFWSAFSFSSKFLVAVSSFVWVSLNSFSNWTIFFSRASTSSLAFGQVPKLSKAQEVGWMWKGEKDTNQFGGKNHLRFEGLSLSPRASGWRSWASLGSDRGRSRAVASSFEDRGPPPQPWKISQKISKNYHHHILQSPFGPC